jgi:phosphotransferase system enzyme I (PtsI)
LWDALLEPCVIVAREIAPGLTVQLPRDRVIGLVSEQGTRTSHAAILAHSMGIPAVMGLADAVERIASGSMVVVDGTRGTVLLKPTPAEVAEARAGEVRRRELDAELEEVVGLPAVTSDGVRVILRGNVDLPEEIRAAQLHRAEGVGLLRTEFLIAGRSSMPSEDEQAAYFRRVGEAFPGEPIVVRTYDLGGDKLPPPFEAPVEANPFLGWRAIRVCLDHPDLLRGQVRAALRAAAGADVRLMLPLVTRVDEIDRTRAVVVEEAERLAAQGIEAARDIPLGVMIETPAAAVLADRIAAESDFISVGTNDLTQYTLAVDRGNVNLAERFTPLHPAVLRLIARTVEVGLANKIDVTVCGEMATQPVMALALIGLGVRTLSVAPRSVTLVKRLVRGISASAAAAAAATALEAGSAEAAQSALVACLNEAFAGAAAEFSGLPG